MVMTRQQIRLAGCGMVAALSAAVLFLYRPSAWAGYAAWSVSRIGEPLFILCSGVCAVGFVLVALSRYRHKPELLAAALALSAALHLLLAASLTFWVLAVEERPHRGTEVRLELALGLPSPIEDMIARQLREELLTPLERDKQDLETGKPSLAEIEPPAAVPAAPDPVAPERAPAILEPQAAPVIDTRRVTVEDAPAARAQAGAETDMEQIVKVRPVETVAVPVAAPPADTRAFEAPRTALAPVAVRDPVAEATVPDLPVPERILRTEAPEIRETHAATPAVQEPLAPRAAIALEKVDVDMNARPEAVAETGVETGVRTGDGRIELAAAVPPRETAPVSLRTVEPPIPPSALAEPAAPQAMPQEIPAPPQRTRPEAPRAVVTGSARAVDAEVTPLVDRALPAVPTAAVEPDSRSLPPAALTAVRAAAPTVPVAVDALQIKQPIPTAPSAPAKSLVAEPESPAPRPGAAFPRIMEDARSEAPRRAEADPAESVRMQIALLRALAAPAGETGVSTNALLRELAAGRAAIEAFPERVSPAPPVPGHRALRATARSPVEPQILVAEQVQMAYRDVPPRLATETDRMAEPRATQEDAGVSTGIVMRQPLMPVATPGIEAPDVTARTEGSPDIPGAAHATVTTEARTPGLTRPDAPWTSASAAPPAAGSLAEAALPSGLRDPPAPASPTADAPLPGAAGSVDMAQAVPVAGRMRTAVLPPDARIPAGEESRAPGSTVPAGTLAPERVAGDMAAMRVPPATEGHAAPEAATRMHTGPAAPQALPQELLAPVPRVRPEAPGARTESVQARDNAVTPLMDRALQVATFPAETGDTVHPSGPAPAVAMRPATRATGDATRGVASPTRPEAPSVSPSAALPVEGSMAATALQSGIAGRSAPAVPEAVVATAPAPGGTEVMAQAMRVAGQVRTAIAPREGTDDRAGGSREPGASAPAGALAVERAGTGAAPGEAPVTAVPRPVLAVSGVAGPRSGTLVDTATAAVAAAGTGVHTPAGVAPPVHARTMDDGATVTLPLAPAPVARAPAAGDEGTPVQRTVDFGEVARAERRPQDDSPLFTEPQGGWNAPPLEIGRGTSGVRLAPEADAVTGHRAAAGADTVTAVRRLMADEMTRDAAAGKKAIYELRAPEKRRFIEDLGGSPETESAVEQALIWLAGAQSDDGRWDVATFKGVELCGGGGDRTDGNVAVTGLSLLAYLGAGYTHKAGRHSETVRKGLEWLIAGQDAAGDLRRGGTLYDQSMATAAICESSSLTGDPSLTSPARLAAEFIMNAQDPEAAWRYEPRSGSDTSVLGWQILALKSAEISGVEIPPKHYAWAGIWLDQVRKGGGGLYAYMPGHGPTPVMTAEGWFSQLFMGEDVRRQGQQESIAYLLENLPEWNERGRGTVHLYYWYYATLAFRLADAPEFDIWNQALKTALLTGHRRDGPAAGSWDPVCQLGPRGGRIYSTAMAALCLQVYYRYLPFYRRMNTPP